MVKSIGLNTNRFLTPDTIVPDPKNPQQYNRYSYTLNNPLNLIDPSGHCTENYQDDVDLLNQCLEGWNALSNYHSRLAYGISGSGEFPGEWFNELLRTGSIETMEALMEGYGIDYGYGYDAPTQKSSNRGSSNNGAYVAEYRARCREWQDCYDPVGDYYKVGGGRIVHYYAIWDQWGNAYLNISISTSPGAGGYGGNIKIEENGKMINIEELAVDQQEPTTQKFLAGFSDGGCGALMLSMCVAGNPSGDYAIEGGIAGPRGVGTSLGYTWLIYDKGNTSPWIWQR